MPDMQSMKGEPAHGREMPAGRAALIASVLRGPKIQEASAAVGTPLDRGA